MIGISWFTVEIKMLYNSSSLSAWRHHIAYFIFAYVVACAVEKRIKYCNILQPFHFAETAKHNFINHLCGHGKYLSTSMERINMRGKWKSKCTTWIRILRPINNLVMRYELSNAPSCPHTHTIVNCIIMIVIWFIALRKSQLFEQLISARIVKYRLSLTHNTVFYLYARFKPSKSTKWRLIMFYDRKQISAFCLNYSDFVHVSWS